MPHYLTVDDVCSLCVVVDDKDKVYLTFGDTTYIVKDGLFHYDNLDVLLRRDNVLYVDSQRYSLFVVLTHHFRFPLILDGKTFFLRPGHYTIRDYAISVYRVNNNLTIKWDHNRSIWSKLLFYPDVLLIGDSLTLDLVDDMVITYKGTRVNVTETYVELGQPGVYELSSSKGMILYLFVEQDIIHHNLDWDNPPSTFTEGTILFLDPNHDITLDGRKTPYVVVDRTLSLVCGCCQKQVVLQPLVNSEVKDFLTLELGDIVISSHINVPYIYSLDDLIYYWDTDKVLIHEIVRKIVKNSDFLIRLWYEIDPDSCAKALLTQGNTTIQTSLVRELLHNQELCQLMIDIVGKLDLKT